MRTDMKIRLEAWMVDAIDAARVRTSPVRAGLVIDSRAEMVRKLIAEALRAREAAKPVPERLAESKKRAAESRARTAAIKAARRVTLDPAPTQKVYNPKVDR